MGFEDFKQRAGKPKGFAAITAERRKEISSLGGKAAKGRHRWTTAEAAAAGRKGGAASAARRAKPDDGEPSELLRRWRVNRRAAGLEVW